VIASVLLSVTSVYASGVAHENDVLRRLVVFPIKYDQQERPSELEDAWWKIREELASGQRFLLASKQFLQQKDVFQPRGALSPADAIILGKLLDAQAIVITFIENRTIRMIAYEGDGGSTLWDHSLSLHPSLPIKSQVVETSRRLIQDFIASFPYQGFVMPDELTGSAVTESNGQHFVKVETGRGLQLAPGDPVQFVRLQRQSLKPLFEEGGQVQLFGEGTVLKSDREQTTVQLTRVSKGELVTAYTLVKFPKEYQRIRSEFALVSRDALNPSVITQDLQKVRSSGEDGKPTATAIAFITSITAFVLLAF
jgi:hypothetical protein